MKLTVDLRQQRTRRGAAIQSGDANTIAATIHFASAQRSRSYAARHLQAAQRHLEAAATAYTRAGMGRLWYRSALWAGEVQRAQTTHTAGAFPVVRIDSTSVEARR